MKEVLARDATMHRRRALTQMQVADDDETVGGHGLAPLVSRHRSLRTPRYAEAIHVPGTGGERMWQRRDRRRRAPASEQDGQGVRDRLHGLVMFRGEARRHVRVDVQLPENGATAADQDDQF